MRIEQTSHNGLPPDPVDREPTNRPGVPMMGAGNDALIGAKPPLDQQPRTMEILIGVEVGRLTPVFGTSVPPRGLSGVIRRRAYRIPEHNAGRWMLLLLGDRVDIWESRLRRHPILALGAVSALLWLTLRRSDD